MTQTTSKPIGEQIQDLCDLQDRYRAAQKVADGLKREFDALSEEVRINLQVSGQDSAGVKNLATVSVATKIVPTDIDWEAVSKFAIENDACYLFQRRLNASAVQELYEQTGDAPGCTLTERHSLRITRSR